MKFIVVGAALALAPAIALAQSNQPQAQSPQTQQQQQNLQQQNQQNQPQENAAQNAQGQSAQKAGAQEMTTKKLLPKDAKLVGEVQATEVRAFPDQMGAKGEQASNIEKEDLVGANAVDRVWTTKQNYRSAVRSFDQKLKGEGIQPIAKTTTQSSTGWNVRMPDGHIANVVVRNTQPTTIEAIQASSGSTTITEPNQQPAPSSKSKMENRPSQQR